LADGDRPEPVHCSRLRRRSAPWSVFQRQTLSASTIHRHLIRCSAGGWQSARSARSGTATGARIRLHVRYFAATMVNSLRMITAATGVQPIRRTQIRSRPVCQRVGVSVSGNPFPSANCEAHFPVPARTVKGRVRVHTAKRPDMQAQDTRPQSPIQQRACVSVSSCTQASSSPYARHKNKLRATARRRLKYSRESGLSSTTVFTEDGRPVTNPVSISYLA
jgi:hypothetical protein